ncbi:hypothetical protein B0T09DRAFT_165899 [Sordaria sp. MPI-SDFR-AT-0083]|nr:hypothetical protein B0T09DRAFT_165899 [Sordaria sp. MPI-SDFR-AT-0083]
MSTTATIPTYRYQYRPSSSSSSRLPTSSFSLFTPRNTLPHHYLESPTNIFLPQQQFSTTNSQPQQPEKIIIRQVGGAGDNHVQWVSISEIIPYSEGESSNGGSGGKHGGKPSTKSLKSYTSQVHGIVHTASWPNHDVGDRLWLRSDQPIIKGRRSVPIVNLDKGVSGEVCISHVTWHPQKRELSSSTSGGNTTITFIGAEYRHGHGHGPTHSHSHSISHGYSQGQQQRDGTGGGPHAFRMCIIQDPSSNSTSHTDNDNGGVIEMISLEELDTCFEDVEDVKPAPPSSSPLSSSVHDHIYSHYRSHSHVPPPPSPPTDLQISGPGDNNHITHITHISKQLRDSRSLRRHGDPRGPRGPKIPRGPRSPRDPAVIVNKTDNRRLINDNDDDGGGDNLSHASFASSSTKGKVAMDLVALSLSIFNFNAAMLDLAALSNQSMGMGMGGLVRDIDERPEAEDDSDEDEEDEEGEEKVWSNCESIQSSGRQSVMSDEEEGERSRVEGSESGSGYDM